ncbi:MAG: DUF4230 domain-containing protein [Clostridia bacterium]|nr:DUF4230 domain-containing protein [Clostridia bacterium]
MREKLMVIKNKFVVAKDKAKIIFANVVTSIKKSSAYVMNAKKFATPFLLIICVLLTMYICSQDKCHELELKEAAEQSFVISEYFVAEELKSIGEINTSEYTYSIERSHSDYRKAFDFNVPFTEKSLTIMYSGKVKVGYNINEMKYMVANDKILFKIPEPVVENYINKELVKDENNNLFNPINSDDYASLREGVLEEGLKKATSKGTYENAETELKNILTKHFEKFGCSVLFI